MARRRGRPGSHLATDDTTGFTVYAETLQRDYWGNLTRFPLKRNLQEIASPFGDPYPVDIYRGPQYEVTDPCQFEVLPKFVGKTNRPFLENSAYAQTFNLNPGIGEMSIGCSFIVGGEEFIVLDDGSFLVTETGGKIIII